MTNFTTPTEIIFFNDERVEGSRLETGKRTFVIRNGHLCAAFYKKGGYTEWFLQVSVNDAIALNDGIATIRYTKRGNTARIENLESRASRLGSAPQAITVSDDDILDLIDELDGKRPTPLFVGRAAAELGIKITPVLLTSVIERITALA